MKTFIILASLYGLVAAGDDPEKYCGLTIEAEKDYQCSEFVTVATDKEKYAVEGLTIELLKLKQLNPSLDCNKPIPRGIEVCVEGPSKFDDKKVQEATTLENFQKAMGKLQLTWSNKFNQKLYDAISDVVKEQKTSRRKRNADSLTDNEKTMIEEFSKESSIDTIKAAIARDPNFKALEEEFNYGRYALCAQLKEKEKHQEGDYHKCICARGKDKYPNGPPPFIHCQAILMKEKIKQQVKMEYNPNELKAYPNENLGRLKAISSNPSAFDFQKFMTKQECLASNCSTTLCFPTGENCGIIPPFPVLSVCASGQGCMPNLLSLVATGGALHVDQFTSSKIGGKVAICITGLHSILSWIGLEACLGAIHLDYYYFKSQLDTSIYKGLVVIKVTAGVKAQVAPSFSKGIGNGIMVDGKKVDDICNHSNHKCQDYCAMETGELAAHVKVEYWWWGWKEAINKQKKPNKECKT